MANVIPRIFFSNTAPPLALSQNSLVSLSKLCQFILLLLLLPSSNLSARLERDKRGVLSKKRKKVVPPDALPPLTSQKEKVFFLPRSFRAFPILKVDWLAVALEFKKTPSYVLRTWQWWRYFLKWFFNVFCRESLANPASRDDAFYARRENWGRERKFLLPLSSFLSWDEHGKWPGFSNQTQ